MTDRNMLRNGHNKGLGDERNTGGYYVPNPRLLRKASSQPTAAGCFIRPPKQDDEVLFADGFEKLQQEKRDSFEVGWNSMTPEEKTLAKCLIADRRRRNR